LDAIIAAVISSVATLVVAVLHRIWYFKKQDKVVEDLKGKLAIKDSNVLIIQTKDSKIPRRLLKSDGEEGKSNNFDKIIVIK
tara:strand:+ start:1698 stop:1943 length:246 start_codon:yes stop_codon:yes gene_type:complete